MSNKLILKNIKQEHKFHITSNHTERIKKILYYQNILLLQDLADHYHWNFDELCQTYLKNNM
jgi:hypothetical protein